MRKDSYSKNKHCKCGKIITNPSKQCQKCYGKNISKKQIGKNNPNFIDGRTKKLYKCLCCGTEIGKTSGIYGNKLCKSCSSYIVNIGKKFSKKHKKNMSISHKGMFIGKKSPRYGKISHSKYIKYNNIYFHSSWEMKFVQFLDLNNIKWLYESKTFDLGNTTYTPDFYIPKWNLYIEIKGYWRDDAKIKFNKFRRFYPQIKIKVLMYKNLKEIGVL